ncbi:hypothetical protein [Pseudonocardia sp. T1-2H]|uniref:hypothetical protein n=1 Tax=Pseudonocardia sp. T1-2H TaxID=3128899 RepID=UPI0031011B3A
MTGVVDQAASWLAAVGGVAGLGSMMKIGVDRRATKTKTDKVAVDTAVGLLAPFKESIEFLKQELADEREAASRRDRAMRGEVGWLREYIGDLVDALRAAGVDVPPPRAVPVPGLGFDAPMPDPEPPPPPRRRAPRRKDPAP